MELFVTSALPPAFICIIMTNLWPTNIATVSSLWCSYSYSSSFRGFARGLLRYCLFPVKWALTYGFVKPSLESFWIRLSLKLTGQLDKMDHYRLIALKHSRGITSHSCSWGGDTTLFVGCLGLQSCSLEVGGSGKLFRLVE